MLEGISIIGWIKEITRRYMFNKCLKQYDHFNKCYKENYMIRFIFHEAQDQKGLVACPK